MKNKEFWKRKLQKIWVLINLQQSKAILFLYDCHYPEEPKDILETSLKWLKQFSSLNLQ